MEIRVLRYFLTIAEKGSITAAAEQLHITQPTLSRQIKDLEEELRQKLFIRSSHSMKLTQEGFIFRQRAEEIISMVDKTSAEFLSMSGTITGDIYIGSGETPTVSLIADIIAEIRKEYPDICCHLYSGNEADVTERLDKGLLDFGILVQPADLTKYDCLHLPAEDTWGVVMRKDSALAQKKEISKNDLLSLPLIMSRQVLVTKSAGNALIDWFGEDFDRLNIVTTFNLIYNAALMVKSGVGYAVSIDGIANISSNSDLCFRPFVPKMTSGLDLIWKKHQAFSPVSDLFLERLHKKICYLCG